MADPIRANELAKERADLLKAEQDIAAGAERISRQEALIVQLRQSGLSVKEADQLLINLQDTQRLWRDHRDLVIKRIAHLESNR